MKQKPKAGRRGLCALLALVMAVGMLAGCGEKKPAEQGGNNPGGSGSGTASTEYVYVASYVPIQGNFSGTLRNPVYANGSIYCTGEERVWVPAEEGMYEPELPGDGEVVLFDTDAIEPAPEVNIAASLTEDVPEDVLIEPVEPGFEGEEEYNGYWDYSTVIYKIGLDGSSKKIPFTPVETEQSEEVSSSAYLSGVSISGAGDIYTMEEVYRSWSDAPEGVTWETDPNFYEKYYHYENKYILKRIDEDGNILNTVDLSSLNPNPDDPNAYFYLNEFKVDSQGNIYVSGDSLYILDSEGNLKNTISAGDDGGVGSLMVSPAGDVYAMTYSWSETSSETRLVKLDPESSTLGEGMKLPGGYNLTPGGGDYDFYYTNGINFFGYKLETGASEKLLNWISCDVNPSYAGSALALEDGRIVVMDSHYDYGGGGIIRYAATAQAVAEPGFPEEENVVNELIILTRIPADQAPKKEILTLATQYLSYNMRSSIIDFNRSNDKFRIEVLDYSEYNTDEDYEAGLTKLKTEIGSGKMPDLLDLNQLPTAQLVGKGMLEDLYPFLDSDPSLSREDILENVRRALEIDGKLYQSVSNFSIQTLMGPPALVGDKPGWTVDQFQAALRSLRETEPRATALDQYTTRSDIFMYCLFLDMNNFVDWNTGKCSFDSEGFIKLLEFANSFPSEFDWENYEWSDEDDAYYRIAHGLQMLAQVYFGGFEAYDLRIYNNLMGGEGVFVGYPTSFGVGNVLNINSSGFAMSSKCANKEAAWEFLRQFFTEEYQSSGDSYGFPSNRNALQKQLRQAMTIEYQRDENGNFLLDENGAKIPVDYGTYGWGEFEVPGGPITQQEADQIMRLIESTDKVYNYDTSIYEIVEEGVAPYFEGERSAEDVAKQIQSKVSLRVNEQR